MSNKRAVLMRPLKLYATGHLALLLGAWAMSETGSAVPHRAPSGAGAGVEVLSVTDAAGGSAPEGPGAAILGGCAGIRA